jgi:uncharacterized membrane protein YoaK (UPF0700 family)
MVALPSAAMGMQNALLRRVGEHRVRTTYITGMLTNTAQGLVEFIQCALTRDSKMREKLADFALYGGIWCSFASGGIAGAFVEFRYGPAAFLLPVLGLSIVAIRDILRPFSHAKSDEN